MQELRALVSYVLGIALLLAIIGLVMLRTHTVEPAESTTTPIEPIASSTEARAATTTPEMPPATSGTSSTSTAPSTPKAKKTSIQATESPSVSVPQTDPNEIRRIENPYTSPALDFETVNVAARSALVNIYCASRTGSLVKPITGSGVIIDESGYVLTNAHVAQYVLLAQSGRLNLFCEVRTGGPAVSKWVPVVAYIPTVWVQSHASDITKSNALGTGEHDYALLSLQLTLDGSPTTGPFPYLKPDTREAVAFVDDNVLTASYPVEFVGGSVVQQNLYPVTSISPIQKLMTFSAGRADVISLGGIIQAQRGASGGVVVNQWNRAVGLVTTTSDAATTGERDLHAVSLSYIDRDMKKQTGKDLSETLALSPALVVDSFNMGERETLTDLLIDALSGN